MDPALRPLASMIGRGTRILRAAPGGRHIRAGWAAASTLLVCLLVAPETRAEAGSRVAIVGIAPGHQLTRQLRAELSMLGFEVVVSGEGEKVETWKQLQSLARELRVAAAIWLPSADEPRLEIWVVDRVTGKTVERTVQGPRGVDPEADRVIAMRVIELLRASFRELELSDRPPEQSEVQPTAAVRGLAAGAKPRPRAVPRFFVNVGPWLALSPGGLGPLGGLRLGSRWLVYGRLGLELHLLLPAVGTSIEAEEGSARVFLGSVAVGPSYLLTDPAGSWHLDLGAGSGTALLPMRGEAEGIWEGRTRIATSIPVYGRAGIAVRIAREQLRLRLDIQSGALIPAATVRFAGREVARWGEPFVVASVLLDLGIR